MGTLRERLFAKAERHAAARRSAGQRDDKAARDRTDRFAEFRNRIENLSSGEEGGVVIRGPSPESRRSLPPPESDDQEQDGGQRQPWRYVVRGVGEVRGVLEAEATPELQLSICWSSEEQNPGRKQEFGNDEEALDYFLDLVSPHVIRPGDDG